MMQNSQHRANCSASRRAVGNRRDFLRSSAASLLWAGVLADAARAESSAADDDPLAPRSPHFAPRAKSVIFLYMSGGVSHVESFDPKPKLYADHGKTVTIDEWQGKPGHYTRYLKQPHWKFQPHGRSGLQTSELFPRIGECVDELCVLRSLKSDHTNHYEATLGMHTGSFNFARPSIGSWVSYGLGTENRNLPSFIVIAPHTPYAGAQTWASDFLPGCHQATRVVPGPEPIPNIRRSSPAPKLQSLELELLAERNARHLAERDADGSLAARIKSFETAFGMQIEAPEALGAVRPVPRESGENGCR